MNKNVGWVKLWRDQFSHEISERKPWCDGYAWSYLYSRANFRPAIVNFRNQYIPVERGQFVTSELKLSKIFGWSRRRTNSFLTSLERGGMCVNRRTQRYVVITICNYDKFQSMKNEIETIDVTTDVTTGGQQVHIDKNNKNDKNVYRGNFQIPSLEEITSYCQERKNKIDPQYFLDYQIARDWKLKGGQKMKDWKAAIRTWEKNEFNNTKKVSASW